MPRSTNTFPGSLLLWYRALFVGAQKNCTKYEANSAFRAIRGFSNACFALGHSDSPSPVAGGLRSAVPQPSWAYRCEGPGAWTADRTEY